MAVCASSVRRDRALQLVSCDVAFTGGPVDDPFRRRLLIVGSNLMRLFVLRMRPVIVMADGSAPAAEGGVRITTERVLSISSNRGDGRKARYAEQ